MTLNLFMLLCTFGVISVFVGCGMLMAKSLNRADDERNYLRRVAELEAWHDRYPDGEALWEAENAPKPKRQPTNYAQVSSGPGGFPWIPGSVWNVAPAEALSAAPVDPLYSRPYRELTERSRQHMLVVYKELARQKLYGDLPRGYDPECVHCQRRAKWPHRCLYRDKRGRFQRATRPSW